MKRHLHAFYLQQTILIISVAFLTVSTVCGQQRAITSADFTLDVIADAGLNQTNPALITDFSLGTPPGDVLFAQGYSNNGVAYANGLPANGQISSPTGHNFQLAPYNAPNDVRLAQGDFSTLSFSNPDRISYDSLIILAAGVGGPVVLTYRIMFTDLSAFQGTITISDWTCIGCSNYAINNLSKIDRTTGNLSGTNQYALIEYKVPVTVPGKQVYGLYFASDEPGTSVANIFAVTGIPSSPLPVTLIYYDAKVKDGSALLQWKTEEESNNKTYIIERASATFPDVFVQVGTVPAASSANGSVYAFTNTPPVSGTYLYRITQVDVDGNKKVLGIRNISLSGKANWIVQDLGTQWKLISANALAYRLMDMSGRVLKAGTGSAGATTISKPSAKGIYLVQVLYNGEWSTQKLIH